MPGGRPTKYNPEILEKTQEYIDGDYQYNGSVIPSKVGLALYLGIAPSTLEKWEKDEDKQEFSGMLSVLLGRQRELLLNSGLAGEFNAAITKLVLAKHGFTDKQETTLQGPDGGPVSLSFNGVPPNAG